MKRWTQLAVIVVVAVAVYFGVRTFRARAMAPKTPTVAARSGPFQVTIQVRGTLTPKRSIQVSAPRISGLIISWLAPNGSHVKQGETVATFDSGTAQETLLADTAALQQAQANLNQVEAAAKISDQQDALNLSNATNSVANAKLNVIQQSVNGVIAGKEAALSLGMSQEALKVQNATIVAHKTANAAKIATASRKLAKAKADYDLINEQIKEMNVQAPISGIISYLTNHSQGHSNEQPFKVGDSVWGNGAFAEIPDMSTLGILAKVPEVVRGKISTGEPIRLSLDSLPQARVSGIITSISALTEPDFGTTYPPPQVFRVNASIDHIDPRLRPNMAGSMSVVTKRIPSAIIVPTTAIFPIEGKPNVYVLQGDKFQAVPVTVFARTADDAAVSGVAAGARVALQLPASAQAAATKAAAKAAAQTKP